MLLLLCRFSWETSAAGLNREQRSAIPRTAQDSSTREWDILCGLLRKPPWMALWAWTLLFYGLRWWTTTQWLVGGLFAPPLGTAASFLHQSQELQDLCKKTFLRSWTHTIQTCVCINKSRFSKCFFFVIFQLILILIVSYDRARRGI